MNEKRVRFYSNLSIEGKICRAIEKCDPEVVRQLLRLRPDINSQTENGITSMHWACGLVDEEAHHEIVQLLLSRNGNPNVKSNEGVTPVYVPASWGFVGILKILIENGGDPWFEDTEGYNDWDVALQKNQWNTLKYLASYMEEENSKPSEESVQCVFLKIREASINALNMAVCDIPDLTNTSTNSVIIVEEHIYSDTEKGVELLEWHYPPLVNQNSVTDATLNEALCTSSDDTYSVNWIGESIDS